MKKLLLWVVGIVLALPVLYVAVIYGASEAGGEIVTLHRAAPDGGVDHIRLWVIDDGQDAIIQHGGADAYWVQALKDTPVVTLERDGVVQTYAAHVDMEACALYHERRAAKYGLSDQIIMLATGKTGTNCTDVPVRLTALSLGESR